MEIEEFRALRARVERIVGQLEGVEAIAGRSQWRAGGHWVANVAGDSVALISELVSAVADQTEVALRWRRIAEGAGKGTATEPFPPRSSDSA